MMVVDPNPNAHTYIYIYRERERERKEHVLGVIMYLVCHTFLSQHNLANKSFNNGSIC